MDELVRTEQDPQHRQDEPGCDAELHIRLCARRLRTGHLEYNWRIEHVSNIDQDGESLKGTFPPFILPHEAGQEVAAAVRSWWKTTHTAVSRHAAEQSDVSDGVQLTLRDFLQD